MKSRNLSARSDIGPDVLRQRRDLYAFALGLILFNLAGGTFGESGSSAALVPIKFADPSVLHAAAWIGLTYFWWRFWLVSEFRAAEAFIQDVWVQVGDSRAVRTIAARAAYHANEGERAKRVEQILSPEGPVPVLWFDGTTVRMSLDWLAPRGVSMAGVHINEQHARRVQIGAKNVELTAEERNCLWQQFVKAFPKAIAYERSFTDYLLPHCVAAFAVLLGLLRLWLTPQLPAIGT